MHHRHVQPAPWVAYNCFTNYAALFLTCGEFVLAAMHRQGRDCTGLEVQLASGRIATRLGPDVHR